VQVNFLDLIYTPLRPKQPGENRNKKEKFAANKIAAKPYPSASGGTKCCSPRGQVRGRTNNEHTCPR
jgi:hypothetical protein